MATPVAAIVAEVNALLVEDQSGELVVTDVGGVKGPIVSEVSHPRFVGGHPMAGSEQEGPDGADPELFAGSTWVLTPTSFTDPRAFSTIQSVIASLGADLVALAPDRHDDLVAVVSHVPHLTAATLMGLATEATDAHTALLRLAAGGFRDMTRIAAGSPAIWPDICRDNAPAILPVLDDLIARLNEVRRIVAEEDRPSLVALLDRAQLARRNLPPRASRPSSVTELHVVIPDRPGVLAQVTTIAGELGVNIEDLEIVHSQYRPRGVLILTVAADAAERVRHSLGEHGFGLSRPGGRRPVIAIDGPAGAGKSTVAKEVARRLGLERLDTGAMYRAVTLEALERGIDVADAEGCAAIARSMNLSVGERVVLNGEDVTEQVRRAFGQRGGVDCRGPSGGARGARESPAGLGGSQRWGSRRRPGHRQRRVSRCGPEDLPHRRLGRARLATRGGGNGRPGHPRRDSRLDPTPRRDRLDPGGVPSRRPAGRDSAGLDRTQHRVCGGGGDLPAVSASGAVVTPPSRGDLIVYRICRFIAVGVSRLYFPGTVMGRENLPAGGAFIVAPVHRSYVDWLIVARITRKQRLRYIVKEEVWKSKLTGRLLVACRRVPREPIGGGP